jgi:hypothetical protein
LRLNEPAALRVGYLRACASPAGMSSAAMQLCWIMPRLARHDVGLDESPGKGGEQLRSCEFHYPIGFSPRNHVAWFSGTRPPTPSSSNPVRWVRHRTADGSVRPRLSRGLFLVAGGPRRIVEHHRFWFRSSISEAYQSGIGGPACLAETPAFASLLALAVAKYI